MKKFLTSHWMLAIMLAFFLAGTYIDFSSSVNFEYYAQTEANPLLRDAYGGFSLTKALLLYGAILIGILVAHFIWYSKTKSSLMWVLLLIIGSKGALLGYANHKHAQHNREEQIRILRQLRDTGSANLGAVTTRNGKTWYRKFAWIKVSEGSLPDINVLVRQPEHLWFPK